MNTPPPYMDVALQCKQQVGEQSLVRGGPFELGDAKHCSAWARAELMSALLCCGRPLKAQVHTDVSFRLRNQASMNVLTGVTLTDKTSEFSECKRNHPHHEEEGCVFRWH